MDAVDDYMYVSTTTHSITIVYIDTNPPDWV